MMIECLWRWRASCAACLLLIYAKPGYDLVRDFAPVTQCDDLMFGFAAVGPVGNTPAQFAAYIQSEIAKWRRAISSTGRKPQ